MKRKLLCRLSLCAAGLALAIQTPAVMAASGTSALDAFNTLTQQDTSAGLSRESASLRLDDVMAGLYRQSAQTPEALENLAAQLEPLCRITNRDLTAYASAHTLPVAKVRNAYFRALAAALKAQISLQPAAEEKYHNIQLILSLFLEKDPSAEDTSSREKIRSQMTEDYYTQIADNYHLPSDFVAFLIMNRDWDDDDWRNDNDWQQSAAWYHASAVTGEDLTVGSKDTLESTRIADFQTLLISLGYLKGKADGIFGPRTQQALVEFQLANGLPATGIYTSPNLYDAGFLQSG